MRLWETFQRLVAVLLLAPASLIVLPFAVLIQIRSPGPLFNISLREGLGGVEFRMLKVRTMVPDADRRITAILSAGGAVSEQWQRYGFITNDPRIAGPAARIARYFSIDELPQLLNVVRGEMNLVGPRPLPGEIAQSMSPRHRSVRRTLKPGMTGLWQVSGRSLLSIREMGRLDSHYVAHRSVGLDIAILLRTFAVVVRGVGAF